MDTLHLNFHLQYQFLDLTLCLKLILKEQAAKLEEFEMTKQKRSKKEEQSVEEKTTLHGKQTETLFKTS